MSIDRKAIRERCERATKGPWAAWSDEGPDRKSGYGQLESVCRHVGDVTAEDHECVSYARGGDEAIAYANGSFIAHAREDVPALLDVVDKMAAALLAIERPICTGASMGVDDWAWPCCMASWDDYKPRAQHRHGCMLDASLTAIGLDTQAKRDAARAELEGR